MIDLLRKNMGVVAGIVCVVLGLFIYLNFFAGKDSSALLTSSAGASPVSEKILISLTSLHIIKLDTALFESPEFQSLTSFGVELAPESVGRRNPFAPVGQ